MAACGLIGLASAARPQAEPLTFAEALRLALATSPEVAAAGKAVEAARAGVAVARQVPNPELTLERAKETPHDAATLAFPLETGGKRSRRVALAEASTRLAEAELQRVVQETRQQVRRAYFALAGAGRQAAVREQQAQFAARIRDAARSRFETGDRPRLDIVQAALALAQAEVDLGAARGAAAGARASLAVLTGRPADAPLTLADDLEDQPLPPAPALTALAVASSRELLRLQQQVEEQAARVELARALQVPDLTLAPSVTHDSPPEFLWGWRAAVTLAVPLFHNHGAEVEVERRTLEQRQAELDGARRRLEGELARALAVADSARRVALVYRDQILPQTEEVERMAEDSYRSGQTGLEVLLQALQATRETRAKAIQAGLDYQAALADLEQAIGAPLP
jgi:cobalt-zinc-cadmium efflux system outer membrane protein